MREKLSVDLMNVLAMNSIPSATLAAHHSSVEIDVNDLEHSAWREAQPVHLTRYWSGEAAPPQRQAAARAIWTTRALCVRFTCRQAEPLIINPEPDTRHKTRGLWERDVCEIFIAPDARTPERYFEFEAAPTGEWLDLAIHQMPDARETNWDYHSGMTTATRIEADTVTIALRIHWQALGLTPQTNTRYRANLFRCVGTGATRGYLAWQPTHTPEPGFHVPQAFGWLELRG
jgi:hypothetical protein